MGFEWYVCPWIVINISENVFKLWKQERLIRHEICHKHHKQRLCKIFTTRVKFHFGNVLVVQFKSYYFGILVISTNIRPKNWISWTEKSAENLNFPQKDCFRTRKLSILQCLRKGQQTSLKTKICWKVLQNMFLVSDLLRHCLNCQ